MLSYDERAKHVMRLLSSEFNELVERMISQKEITPDLINEDLINQMADLVVDIEGEKTETVTKIKDFISELNQQLQNRPYFEQAIQELPLSESLKNELTSLLDQNAFTEQQYRILFSAIGKVTDDVYQSQEQEEDPLLELDRYQHRRIQESKES